MIDSVAPAQAGAYPSWPHRTSMGWMDPGLRRGDGLSLGLAPLKPLLFRGGVGVGAVVPVPRMGTAPTPIPSPEGEGCK